MADEKSPTPNDHRCEGMPAHVTISPGAGPCGVAMLEISAPLEGDKAERHVALAILVRFCPCCGESV